MSSEKHEHSMHNHHMKFSDKPETHVHNKHLGHHAEDFKKKFIFSLLLTIPLVILSSTIQDIFGYSLLFEFTLYFQLFIASFLFFYCGLPFLKGAINEIKDYAIGMMTLISVAISVAYLYSAWTVSSGNGMDFLWELRTLISIMLLGHYLEMKSIMGAASALDALVQLLPSTTHKIFDDRTIDIAIENIVNKDQLLIKANEKIPADGIVISGSSYVDESMLTGESKPIKKSIHDSVIGGSINVNRTITIEVVGIGKESYLSKGVDMVTQAQETKSKTQNLAGRAAKWLTYIALYVDTLTFIVWFALGKTVDFALMMAVGVMTIACPHALGLAIPLVASNSISRVAQNGVLIRNRTTFENSGKVTTVIFDKTGTLTKGNFAVFDVHTYEQLSEKEILQLAYSIERYSEHPIAQSIVTYAKRKKIRPLEVTDFKTITAQGVEGMIDKRRVRIVSPKGISDTNKITINQNPQTIVYVIVDDVLYGDIMLADEVRSESFGAINSLKRKGIKVYMATGDNDQVAKYISDTLQLDGYFSELLPNQKLEVINDM